MIVGMLFFIYLNKLKTRAMNEEEVKVEQTPEAPPAKSKKEMFGERMRAKYPDMNMDDEEAFYSRINDDYDDYENQLGEYKKRDKELSDMFMSDPRSAQFLMAWKSGEDPIVQYVRNFGKDMVATMDDPAMAEQIAVANKEFLDRMAESDRLEAEYKANLETSLKNLSDMQAEMNLSDKQIDDAMDKLAEISKDFLQGKFSRETVDIMMKAMNYDTAVAQASDEGEVRGRNAKIEEKLRKAKKGDGVASLDGKNAVAKPKKSSGVLDQYGEDYSDIWGRGGEKRKRY